VPGGLHAVERNRSLAAQALGYTTPVRVEYGIRADRKSFRWLATERYAVLLHATSAREKLWPEERWITLGNALHERGLRTVLPWGSPEERARSDRLAAAIRGALVPPALVLSDLTSVLSGALFAIGVDTGLTHLAGALGVATVGIFSSTDPASTGLFGCARAANVGHVAASPAADEVLRALERLPA
jgi:heptosyltransferase-1